MVIFFQELSIIAVVFGYSVNGGIELGVNLQQSNIDEEIFIEYPIIDRCIPA